MNIIEKVLKDTYKATIFNALGINFEKVSAQETLASLIIDERHLQPKRLVHGGVYVVLAESVASIAAMCTVDINKESVVALEINANHLRPALKGKLLACAKIIHMGKKTRVYESKVTNDDNLISISRCTLMVVAN